MAMRAAALILACFAYSSHARTASQEDTALAFARLAKYLAATEPAAFQMGARAAVAAKQMRHRNALMDAYTHDPESTGAAGACPRPPKSARQHGAGPAGLHREGQVAGASA